MDEGKVLPTSFGDGGRKEYPDRNDPAVLCIAFEILNKSCFGPRVCP